MDLAIFGKVESTGSQTQQRKSPPTNCQGCTPILHESQNLQVEKDLKAHPVQPPTCCLDPVTEHGNGNMSAHSL